MWNYTDKVKEHFLEPKNIGVVEDADGVGEVGSLACGDALKLTFKLDENKRIQEAKFQTFGCASAIASSSALTEMLKGLTLEEAEKISNEDIVDYLGGLPREKMHCSVMGRDALERAIRNYRGEAEPETEGEIVCECFGVTDKQIEREVREHLLTTVEEVTDYVKAGGGCGNCLDQVQEIIDRVRQEEGHRPESKKTRMTNIQKINLIQETLKREISPMLQKDGGDIELVDVEGDRVLVRMKGTCSSCVKSETTLRDFVQNKLRELVTPELDVREV
mgnify:CR=1 FL=1